MPVLDRDALEASPLADLHLIANEVGLDGFRRLRKADLIDAIVARQEGAENGAAVEEEPAEEQPRRRSRGGRSRSRRAVDADEGETVEDSTAEAIAAADEAHSDEEGDEEEDAGRSRRRRGRRGGRGRSERAGADVVEVDRGDRDRGRDRDRDRDRDEPVEEKIAEGVVELAANGSGFLRAAGAGQVSDDDAYISGAQVKRCELVAGDRIAGPIRAPRRSERFPSLIRIDTINGRPAEEAVVGTRFDDLPAAFPSERLELGGSDPTLQAIDWLTPIGLGSRVTITGPARAGKSETLRRIAAALAGRDGLEVSLVIAGVRPEELVEWQFGPVTPISALSFAAPADHLAGSVESALDVARRIAARGGNAVVLVDTLDVLSASAARRALAAARNVADGGSLTVIATASEPLGGETTVIALDPTLAALRRFPALERIASGTLRPELLVGEAGADAIATALAEVLDPPAG